MKCSVIKGLLFLSVFLVIAFMGFCLLAHTAHHSQQPFMHLQQNAVIQTIFVDGTFIRCLLLAIVILAWPQLVKWLGHYRKWDKAFIELLIKQRWWVMVSLLFFEFLLVISALI
jgi:hypothetical protein